MGVLSYFWRSSSSPPAPDTGAPTRSARELCWASRDAYFNCLETAKVNVPGQEPKGTCQTEVADYEKTCAASWVSCSTWCSSREAQC